MALIVALEGDGTPLNLDSTCRVFAAALPLEGYARLNLAAPGETAAQETACDGIEGDRER